jgi:hypothetical protein
MLHRNNRTDINYQIKRINHLLEYKVNESEPMDSFSELNEEEPTEDVVEEPKTEEPTKQEEVAESDDTIDNIVMLHAENIDKTMEYIEQLLLIVDKQNNEIELMKNDVSNIAHDVKQLIPPTPKEQLYNQMKKATPYMISVDDYWNEYEKKFKLKDPLYNEKTGQYEIDKDKADSIVTQPNIKDSFY